MLALSRENQDFARTEKPKPKSPNRKTKEKTFAKMARKHRNAFGADLKMNFLLAFNTDSVFFLCLLNFALGFWWHG